MCSCAGVTCVDADMCSCAGVTCVVDADLCSCVGVTCVDADLCSCVGVTCVVDADLCSCVGVTCVVHADLHILADRCPSFAGLDRLVEPLRATCTTKVKAHSVKQEFEKQDELKRSALRAVVALLNVPDAGEGAEPGLVKLQGLQ